MESAIGFPYSLDYSDLQYLVDNAIQLLNNWGQDIKVQIQGWGTVESDLVQGIRVQGKIDLVKKKLGRNCIFEFMSTWQNLT